MNIECCICLNEIKPKKRLQLPKYNPHKLKCNHIFHIGCIKRWSKVNKKCPLCQEPFINYYYGFMLQSNSCFTVCHKLTFYDNYLKLFNKTIYYISISKLYTHYNTIVIGIGENSFVFLHNN